MAHICVCPDQSLEVLNDRIPMIGSAITDELFRLPFAHDDIENDNADYMCADLLDTTIIDIKDLWQDPSFFLVSLKLHSSIDVFR